MSDKYWDQVWPTYLENWPEKLHKLSIRSIDIPLTIDDAIALGSNIIELKETFASYGPLTQPVGHIGKALYEAFKQFPKGAFVRLGSRSPKDRLYNSDIGYPCKNYKQALSVLLSCSERIADDLHLAINNNYKPHIWVRQWVDIPKWTEFRCFVHRGELIGISQYFYNEYFPDIEQHHAWIERALKFCFKNAIKPACHLDTYIFDIFLSNVHQLKRPAKGRGTGMVDIILIEINPFIDVTDFCLYNDCRKGGIMSPPDFSKFDRGIRYVKEPINKQDDEKEFIDFKKGD